MIALAENPLSSSRSKHIDVRHHFLRNLTEWGVIEVTHFLSEKQNKDILTKALPIDLFEVHRDLALDSRDRSLSRFFFIFDIYIWSGRYNSP